MDNGSRGYSLAVEKRSASSIVLSFGTLLGAITALLAGMSWLFGVSEKADAALERSSRIEQQMIKVQEETNTRLRWIEDYIMSQQGLDARTSPKFYHRRK